MNSVIVSVSTAWSGAAVAACTGSYQLPNWPTGIACVGSAIVAIRLQVTAMVHSTTLPNGSDAIAHRKRSISDLTSSVYSSTTVSAVDNILSSNGLKLINILHILQYQNASSHERPVIQPDENLVDQTIIHFQSKYGPHAAATIFNHTAVELALEIVNVSPSQFPGNGLLNKRDKFTATWVSYTYDNDNVNLCGQ